MTCKDPDWMNTSVSTSSGQGTFYPAGTECYRDPTTSSCFPFGNSGSGVLRKITRDSQTPVQYAFTGPLSMSKSCDGVWIVDKEISYSAENPGIFTDAYCYLPWIAAAYGMQMPHNHQIKPSCGRSVGDQRNIDLEDCVGHDAENLDRGRCQNWESESFTNSDGEFEAYTSLEDCLEKKPFYNNSGTGRHYNKCDFTYNHTYVEGGEVKSFIWDKCRLLAQEGYSYNIYICKVFLCTKYQV